MNYFTHTNELPISAKEVESETMKNPVLSKVWHYVMTGWPEQCKDAGLMEYFKRRHELSVDQGCVLWGTWVVIPPRYHQRILTELHAEHLGITRIKALARSYCWFTGMENKIESLISNCDIYQSVKGNPPTAPLLPWRQSLSPSDRVHIDFFTLDGKDYFILIDS